MSDESEAALRGYEAPEDDAPSLAWLARVSTYATDGMVLCDRWDSEAGEERQFHVTVEEVEP